MHSQPINNSELGNKLLQYGHALQILEAIHTSQNIVLNIKGKEFSPKNKIANILSILQKEIGTNNFTTDDDIHIHLENFKIKVNLTDCSEEECTVQLIHVFQENVRASDHITCRVKLEKLEAHILIDNQKAFSEETPRPRGFQCEVMATIGEKLLTNENQGSLLLLGTGSGKSFIQAALSYISKKAIYIVPNLKLATELDDDAIKIIHGKQCKVVYSIHYNNIEAFKDAIKNESHVILIADDPFFFDKAKVIENEIILIDESHEHTYKEKCLSTLKMLKERNLVFALTGTPTSRLFDLFQLPVVDINLNKIWQQKNSSLRPLDIADKSSLKWDVIENTIKTYYGCDLYNLSGPQFKDPRESLSKRGVTQSVSKEPIIIDDELKVIQDAIQNNLQRVFYEKSFIFSDDEYLRRKFVEQFNNIAEGAFFNIYSNLAINTRSARHFHCIQEAVRLFRKLHPEIDEIPTDLPENEQEQWTKKKKIYLENLTQQFQSKIKYGPIIHLKNEIQLAQKRQIANALNEVVLNFLFPDIRPQDFGKKIRTKQMANSFIDIIVDMQENPDTDKNKNRLSRIKFTEEEIKQELINIFNKRKLSQEQKDKLSLLILNTIQTLQALIRKVLPLDNTLLYDVSDLISNNLLQESDINLHDLQAKYAMMAPKDSYQIKTSSDKKAADEMAQEVIDSIHFGLVMIVLSGSRFATGINIPSLRCTFIVIDDPIVTRNVEDYLKLSSPVLIMQAAARSIRDQDGRAYSCIINANYQPVFLIQEILPDIIKNSVLPLSDVVAVDSGKRMQLVYENYNKIESCKNEEHQDLQKEYEKISRADFENARNEQNENRQKMKIELDDARSRGDQVRKVFTLIGFWESKTTINKELGKFPFHLKPKK